jgi:hypothetical protein
MPRKWDLSGYVFASFFLGGMGFHYRPGKCVFFWYRHEGMAVVSLVWHSGLILFQPTAPASYLLTGPFH